MPFSFFSEKSAHPSFKIWAGWAHLCLFCVLLPYGGQATEQDDFSGVFETISMANLPSYVSYTYAEGVPHAQDSFPTKERLQKANTAFIDTLRAMGLKAENLPEKMLTNPVLTYLNARNNSVGGLTGGKNTLQALKENPRKLWNFLVGGGIGGSAAYAWAMLMGYNPNVAYFLFPSEGRSITTTPIFWTTFAIALLPEILSNRTALAGLRPQDSELKASKEPHSKAHQFLTWMNRAFTTAFMGKFFSIYYSATWGLELADGVHNGKDSDYWFVATYLWSNWFKGQAALNHKIHLIDHKFFGHHSPAEHARHSLQARLAASYRKFQAGADKDVLQFAAFIHQLNKNAQTEEEKRQATLAILSYLYGYAAVTPHANSIPQEEVSDAFQTLFGVQEKPLSLKLMETGGRVFATSVMPLALLGAYFAWDSVLEETNVEDEHYHFEDNGMHSPSSWAYASCAALYAGVNGYVSGPVWGRNLWCRYNGVDPNQYQDHLEYWAQNYGGLRTLVGGGLTYAASSLLMFPIAGLAAEQIFATTGDKTFWFIKPSLAACAQWGVMLDTSFMNPRYQELIGRIGHFCDGDKMGTIKDDALKLIVSWHDSFGRLKADKVMELEETLASLETTRTENMQQWAERQPTEAWMSNEDGLEETAFDATGATSVHASPPSVDEDTLTQPLLEDSEYLVTNHTTPGQPGLWKRFQNWLLGQPVPDDLQGLVAQARS